MRPFIVYRILVRIVKQDFTRNPGDQEHIQEAGATWLGLCTVLGVPAVLGRVYPWESSTGWGGAVRQGGL
jgi:hypothetical protein